MSNLDDPSHGPPSSATTDLNQPHIHVRVHNDESVDVYDLPTNSGTDPKSDNVPNNAMANLEHGHITGSTNHKLERQSSHGAEDEDAKKVGLCNFRAFLFLILWYFFSAFTLFLNKYILSTLRGEPTLLGTMQMVMTTVFGFLQMYLPLGMYTPVQREGKPPHFWRNMILVGTMRFLTVILGLVALKFVAVSFTETVKSSAPIFTVFISQVVIGEVTGACTMLSLIPIMGGLALCSANELSFNIQGFVAALATNLTECFQNVYSKLLISGKNYKYTPAELQFYTSLSSIAIQLPLASFMLDLPKARQSLDVTMLTALVMNGIFFHFQSITAYVLMDYISPVTHSVANTVKRAFLIWLSVIIFGNPVTFLSGLGTITVTVGVLLYTKAKEYDHTKQEIRNQYPRVMQTDGTKIV